MNRPSQLPEAVNRCLQPSAPVSLRVEVARGVIPQCPAERLTTLVRLLADPAPEVREAARGAWKALPPDFFDNAVGDPDLDESALDLIVGLGADRSELVYRVLEHPRVGPRTLDRLADSDDEEILVRIATNQRLLGLHRELARRLLANPHLHIAERGRLESLYETRQDTIEHTEPDLDRALPPELLEESETGRGEDAKNLYQLVQSLTVAEKIKLATLGGKGARRLLLRDTNKVVATAVIRSPKIREDEIQAVAQDRTVHEEILRIILQRKDWLKSYPLRVALCQNPKTPIPRALRLLETLQERDLRQVSKSRNVSSPISAGATRILARRGKI